MFFNVIITVMILSIVLGVIGLFWGLTVGIIQDVTELHFKNKFIIETASILIVVGGILFGLSGITILVVSILNSTFHFLY